MQSSVTAKPEGNKQSDIIVAVQSGAVSISPMQHLGSRLRRLRRLQEVKQSVLAELAGVTQATVSRWESGGLEPSPELAGKLLARLAERGSKRTDDPLRRLVNTSSVPVHLIGDADHRLLAASCPREREGGQTAAGLIGCPL